MPKISEESLLLRYLVASGKPWKNLILRVFAFFLLAAILYFNKELLSRCKNSPGTLEESPMPMTFITEPYGLDPTNNKDHFVANPLSSLIDDECDWLASCQLPSGALSQTPGSTRVIPYFGNLAARTLLNIEPEIVQKYISWYLNNLNKPDRWGISGTIYDYKVANPGPGETRTSTEIPLQPTKDYDSADSYAATFLSLAADYYFSSGDKDYIVSHMDDINLVAEVILDLQDSDGLVFVKPGSWTKYLMDNAENYRGLVDWSRVLQEEGYKDQFERIMSAALRIETAVKDLLYDATRQTYAWSLSPLRKRFPKASKWYPDQVSQLYLITCGLVAPNDPRAVTIWRNFNSHFPFWVTGFNNDEFPWGSVALTSIIMGETDKAFQFVKWVDEAFIRNNRPYPWYILESSNLITLVRHLSDLIATSQIPVP